MKSVNFIKNTNPHKHAFIRRWICCSCLLIFIVCTVLIALSLHQYHTYNTAQSDYLHLQTSAHQLDAILQEKRTLKEKSDFLKQQCTKIIKIKERPTTPTPILTLFNAHTGRPVILDGLHIHKKDITITLHGNSILEILQYVHELSEQKMLKNIFIISIDPSEQQIKVIVNAQLTH